MKIKENVWRFLGEFILLLGFPVFVVWTMGIPYFGVVMWFGPFLWSVVILWFWILVASGVSYWMGWVDAKD